MMTIKLKTIVGEGQGAFMDVSLPTELVAGVWITGSVAIINNGFADTMAFVLITEWDGKAYGAVFNLGEDENAIITLDTGVIAMPNQDAVITLYACHAQPGGEFLIGSVEFKIDDTRVH